MNLVQELRRRFRTALTPLVPDPSAALDMIRPAQDPRFGDYQANCAMSLGKQLGRPPREIAQQIVQQLVLDDMCQAPEIAGPGFINLRLRDDWLAARLLAAAREERLGVPLADPSRTYVIDYSSPNVAKPMHVGHLRSTIIGDALCRTLRFLGHRVISDNHLGDWGTQFGMIIYGFKHFVQREAYERRPIEELTRLYKLVNQLVEHFENRQKLQQLGERLPPWEADLAGLEQRLAAATDKKERSKLGEDRKLLARRLEEARKECDELALQIQALEQDPHHGPLLQVHADIGQRVLEETARLHAGDSENRQLWEEFLPKCRQDTQRLYNRLGIHFDYQLGESYYDSMLAEVVQDLERRGLAQASDGATCVFLEGYDTPMIIRKSDGAFLYATTDLATIRYRAQHWRPDVVLYVVDHRQGEHFGKLFAAARLWGYDQVDLRHISFGTVLDEKGKPIKTRGPHAVLLEDLLERAVQEAFHVVCTVDDAKEGGRELSDADRRGVAEAVGLGAVKYRDLSHNRTSDYAFSFEKMLDLKGNTAPYMQYAYARVQNIFARGNIDRAARLRQAQPPRLEQSEERQLALALLRFQETLDDTASDYRPNILTAYLYELAGSFSTFYNNCPVLSAPSPEVRESRLLLCELTGRTIRTGLGLLGIDVLDKM